MIFLLDKKHTALTIPVWSPTTVLGKPNPAWLRSSDGIRYIQGGMTVWCRYSFFIALIPKPKNFSFTSSYSLLYYRHSLFFQQPISVTHFFSPIFTTKRFLSPPWFFFTSTIHTYFSLPLKTVLLTFNQLLHAEFSGVQSNYASEVFQDIIGTSLDTFRSILSWSLEEFSQQLSEFDKIWVL